MFKDEENYETDLEMEPSLKRIIGNKNPYKFCIVPKKSFLQ